MGESSKLTNAQNQNTQPKQTYAAQIQPTKTAAKLQKADLIPIKIVDGEPTIEFSLEEVNGFSIEEGLHQAVVIKFSYGKPDLCELR